MKKTLAILSAVVLAAAALGFGTGCTTTTSTASDGTTTTAKTVNWTAVNAAAQSASYIATVAVLNNNPDLSTAFTTINTALSAILVGTPTQAQIASAITALDTGLDDAEVLLVAAAIYSAYNQYLIASGETSLVTTDEHVTALIKAISAGITQGVTDAKALTAN